MVFASYLNELLLIIQPESCALKTGLLVVPMVSNRGQSLQLSGPSSLQPELWVTVRFIFCS